MNSEIAKTQVCVLLISGIELWIDEDRGRVLQKLLLEIRENKFVSFEGRSINTSSISGIFTPLDMANQTRRKNGQWTCRWGEWHEKGEKCGHVDPAREKEREKFNQENGYYPLS